MTHEEFNALYNEGKIQVKIYANTFDNLEKCVEAFEYDGKYYLRIHNVLHYVTGVRAFNKRYAMTRESHFIKEFNNKEYANNYFKKAAKGLKRITNF